VSRSLKGQLLISMRPLRTGLCSSTTPPLGKAMSCKTAGGSSPYRPRSLSQHTTDHLSSTSTYVTITTHTHTHTHTHSSSHHYDEIGGVTCCTCSKKERRCFTQREVGRTHSSSFSSMETSIRFILILHRFCCFFSNNHNFCSAFLIVSILELFFMCWTATLSALKGAL